MKKTLAAVAILGAFAGSAMADVTVYGKVDLGLGYTNVDGVSHWEMKSGGSAASRVGLKGSEKIGDLTVGFNYEAAFTADDGRMNTAPKLTAAADGTVSGEKERFWSRVAMLNVKGAFGEVGAGYYGALDAATGPYDFVGGLSAMGTGYFGVGGQDYVMVTRSRLDNAVTYKAPTFAGLTLAAQVASASGDEFEDEVDMYYGAAAKYAAGNFGAGLVVSKQNKKQGGVEDLNVTAGVNYNFGVAKAFLAANYYDDGAKNDSFGVVASVAMPVMGGDLQLQAGYGEKETGANAQTDTTFAGAFYKYPLSKQTYVYGAAGWDQKDDGAKVVDAYRGIFGMCHNF